MKIKINFIDSLIDFEINNIYSLEIYNKKYLYRISNLFYLSNIGEISNEILLFENNKEINISNKIRFYTNYFDFNFKQYSSDLIKYINKNIEIYNKEIIFRQYNKLNSYINRELQKLDLPIFIKEYDSIEDIFKSNKVYIEPKEYLLDNLLLLIDIEKELQTNKILCFVNLKDYLNESEINEFYKYVIYNNIKVILIESKEQKHIKNYEKIIIIDENLNENMI